MSQQIRFLCISLGCAVLVLVVIQRSLRPSTPSADPKQAGLFEVVPKSVTRASPDQLKNRARDQAAHERETLARVSELTQQSNEQQRHARAAGRTMEMRRFLQRAHEKPWTAFVQTNLPAFLQLREKAASTHGGAVPCTLCDGKGAMKSCVLCPEHNGKCVTCAGNGTIDEDELCPTCLGTTKCFLCVGSGRMLCPFCNDGMVEVKTPAPPELLPIE